MAQELETPTSFNFSLDESSTYGDTKIIDDLFAPETTPKPEEVEKIKKEEPVKKEEKVKETVPDPKKESEENLKNFFGKDEDEELETEEDSKKKTTTTEDPIKKEGEEEQPNPEIFSSLSKELFKLNVFTPDEDEKEIEIKTPEEFLDRFNYEKKKGANEIVQNFIGQFGEDYQNAFQAIFVNGADPKDYFSAYNEIVNIAELDITKESSQETIVKQALKEQGFEGEEITAELEKIKQYGDLEEKAKRFQQVLTKKKAQELQQLQQEAEIKQKQQTAAKQQYVTNISSILEDKLKTKEFDGIPLNPKLVQEVRDSLIKDSWQLTSGEKITDFDKWLLDLKRPENHALKVKVALLSKVLEKDPTLSTLIKSDVTKKSDKLFSNLVTKDNKSKKEDKPKSWWQQ